MRSIVAAGAVLAGLLAALPVLAQNSPDKPAASQEMALPEIEIPFSDATLEEVKQVMRAARPDPQYDPSKPVVGFGISRNLRGAHIDVVVPNSAAEGAGLDVGMTILSINGVALADFDTAEIVKIIGAIEGEIVFAMADGRTISLIKAPIPQAAD